MKPESEFRRPDPSGGVDIVGSPTDVSFIPCGENIGHDHGRLDPLHVWGHSELAPAAEPSTPQPAEEPTEAELRQRLLLWGEGEAREKLQAATASFEAAQQAYLCAKSHRHDCEVELHTLDSLEAEIALATTEALCSFAGRPDMAKFSERLHARTAAEAALLGAQTVERVLALRPLMLLARERLRPEIDKLQARLSALRQAWARGDGAEPWRATGEALRADPLNASVDVVVPDQPEAVQPPAAGESDNGHRASHARAAAQPWRAPATALRPRPIPPRRRPRPRRLRTCPHAERSAQPGGHAVRQSGAAAGARAARAQHMGWGDPVP